LLRQFLDTADEIEGLLMVVLAPQAFLMDSRRGVDRYEALKLRVWDDIRPKHRQNPLASLVRIQRKSGFSIEERTPENCRGGTNLKEHHLNGVLDYHKDWLQHQIDGSYEVGVIEDSDGHLMVGATNSVSSSGILGGTSGTSASCAE